MICELCGSDFPRLRTIEVEGTRLEVCPKCQQYGVVKVEPRSMPIEAKPDRDLVKERLERREKRKKGRDIYSSISTELVEDYPRRIRKARQKRGLDQKALAAKINEKKSIIAKIETGAMHPDDRLLGKLEKALGIKLTEEVSSAPTGGIRRSGPMTIGEMIMIKMKENKK